MTDEAVRELGEIKEKMVDLRRQLDQIVRRGNEVARERDAANAEAQSVNLHFQTLTRMATAVGQQNELLKAQVAVLQERAGKAADRLLRDKEPDAAAVVEAINMLTFGSLEDPSKTITLEAEAMLKGEAPNALVMSMSVLEAEDPEKAALVRANYEAERLREDAEPPLRRLGLVVRDPADPFKLLDS